MRNITPVQIWSNGQSKNASVLVARIINDDLSASCTFYYELKEADTIVPPVEEGGPSTTISGSRLTDGNISMTGNDYLTWDGSNGEAYTFIADQLNLTLIAE
jgi:hypothetical protein